MAAIFFPKRSRSNFEIAAFLFCMPGLLRMLRPFKIGVRAFDEVEVAAYTPEVEVDSDGKASARIERSVLSLPRDLVRLR